MIKQIIRLYHTLSAKWEACEFIDKVSGREVHRYRRADGTGYLANSRFDALFFNVPSSPEQDFKKG